MENNTFIIAEIGCNHNGDVDLAYQMVDRAIKSGVDAIKFQTFKSEKLISKNAPKAEYAVQNTGNEESQLEMTKKLELSYDDYIGLFKYVEEKGLTWFSTPFDDDSINFLHSLGMNIWKIPSGEVTNLPYLRKIGSFGGQVIISNGMASVEELDQALKILKECGTTDITVLHCITEYPAPDAELNLSTVPYFIERYGKECTIGYSDHSVGYEAAIIATTLGAKVIEKHFTLDNEMEGPDHKASANPQILDALVAGVRKTEVMLGEPKILPTPSEVKNKTAARKSIVANVTIKEGEVFTEENLTTKRPGNGMSPMLWDDILGKKATRTYNEDDLINE